jgi:hypothetical protein
MTIEDTYVENGIKYYSTKSLERKSYFSALAWGTGLVGMCWDTEHYAAWFLLGVAGGVTDAILDGKINFRVSYNKVMRENESKREGDKR